MIPIFERKLSRRRFHLNALTGTLLLPKGLGASSPHCPPNNIKDEARPVGLNDQECLLWSDFVSSRRQGRLAIGLRLWLEPGAVIDRIVLTNSSREPIASRYFHEKGSESGQPFIYLIFDQLVLSRSRYMLHVRVRNGAPGNEGFRIFRKAFSVNEKTTIGRKLPLGSFTDSREGFDIISRRMLPTSLIESCQSRPEDEQKNCLDDFFIQNCWLSKVSSNGEFELNIHASESFSGFFLVLDPVGRPLAMTQADYVGQSTEGLLSHWKVVSDRKSMRARYHLSENDAVNIFDCPYLMVLGSLKGMSFYSRQDLWLSY